MMMIKEHLIERYGVPRWMVGWGGSGGAIQQLLIAQNYPGIMDGLLPDAAFPDVFGTAQAVSDCRLLNRYFIANPASDAVRKAFEGHMKSTCKNWDAGNGDAVLANNGSISPACGLNDASKVYDPVTNPGGARCTIYDVNINSLGRDPLTGFARRPLDNMGIQYGLKSLERGEITAAEFLDINEGIGGYDVDGNIVARRTVGDAEALRRSWALGRVNSGGGGLANLPILQLRNYAEPGGDIHTIYNDIQIREKLERANGRSDNQVVWLAPHPALAPPAKQLALAALSEQLVYRQLDLMTQWLDGLAGDDAPLTPEKVAKYKPAGAVDSCWDLDAQRHEELASYDDAGACNTMYPKTPTPRIVAGGPLTDDVLKCQLKPARAEDYEPLGFTPAQLLRLRGIFPDGVCDYGRPGVGQTALEGVWLEY